jgi:Lrp/AsnC family leucine-responsive transcriptional regulator
LIELDETDVSILEQLQLNARRSMTELGRLVSLSAAATTERVRRLEEAGVIQGYHASVNPSAIGYDVAAFVRLKYPHGNYKPLHDLLATTAEVTAAHHVTGDDCFVLQVVAHSMRHLEQVTGRLAGLGAITTSVVYSSALAPRPLRPFAANGRRSRRRRPDDRNTDEPLSRSPEERGPQPK